MSKQKIYSKPLTPDEITICTIATKGWWSTIDVISEEGHWQAINSALEMAMAQAAGALLREFRQLKLSAFIPPESA